jgi:hypothetical protein
MTGISVDSTAFDAIPFGPTLRPASGYTAEFLGQVIFDIRGAIESIIPLSTRFGGMDDVLQRSITGISVMVAQAEQTASMELQSQFSSQHLKVGPEERDRKFLVDGFLPINVSMRKCLHCGLRSIDEPNANNNRARANQLKHAAHQSQLVSDRAIEAGGGVVLNNRGEPMQAGRKRNEPKYDALVLNCHAGQFGCTTHEGPVPAVECPIGCIDDATGERYGFDVEGDCNCPLCKSRCRAFYTPTAHQMFKASTMLTANGGELNVSSTDTTATRHNPPPSVIGNFHHTAQSMGDVINRHAHSAVQGALMAAREDIRTGHKVSSLDLTRVHEEVGMFTGREIAETLHGDSSHAVQLHKLAAAAGPPSVFTTLKGDGSIFNTRCIPSCNKNHRQTNNRLEPMVAAAARERGPGAKRRLYPQGLQSRQKQSRQKPKQLFGSPMNADSALDLNVLKAVENTIVQNVQNKNVQNNSDGSRVFRGNTIPKSLENTFFTRPATMAKRMAKCTPIPGSETTKAIKEIDLCVSDEKIDLCESDEEKITYTQQLVERALDRSFNETGAVEVFNVDTGKTNRQAAIRRMNMITENPGKVNHLVELYVERMQTADKKINSPSVNTMLDIFL